MASESHMFSSPVRGAHDASLITVSSSPEFPSISDMLAKPAKKPPLRSGSRAAPIPETGFKSFTTATDLWRSKIDDFENDGFLRDISEVVKSPTDTRREPPASTTVVSHSATVVTSEVQCAVSAPTEPKVQPTKAKRVYKPRAKKTASTEAPADGEAPPKPAPKPRRKAKEKDPSDGQTTLPKGKVTKATAAKPKQTKKRAETVSKHFPAAEAPVKSIEIDEPIDLEPALARRIDWTPTKDTTSHIVLLDSSTTKEAVPFGLSSAVSSLQPRKDLFTNLRDTYGCADEDEKRKASPPPGEPVDILGKRKLIEMVTTGGSTTPEVSPTKPKAKAAKKKPRTITELATAAYRVPEIVEDTVKEDESVLNYFTVEQDSVSGENEKKTIATGKSKATKPGAKPKPKRATKKKAAVPQPVLLSPTSALRQVSRQDFVFGTSSQLATEQDAGLLRDIQLAMKASNQEEDYNPFASSPVNISVARKPSGNRLWGAGARDEFGDLLQVEVIDLVDSPAIPKDLTNPEVILSLVEPTKAPQLGIEQTVVPVVPTGVNTIELSNSLTSQTPAQPTSYFFSTQKKTTTATVQATINSIATPLPPPSSVLLADFDWDDEPPASNQEQFHLMASQAVKSPPKGVDPPTMTKAVEPTSVVLAVEDAVPVPAVPKYESCTDEQLAREIKRYGFKPIKRRAAAIALLTECWMSKNKSKLAGVAHAQGTTASMSTTSNTAAKATATAAASAPTAPRPRGRPKKDASTAPLVSADVPATVPAEAAKKPRGRPKKEANTTTTAKTTSKRTAKASLLPPPSEPSTPKRRKKSPSRAVIEIADSDAEDTNPFLSSPSVSPSLSPEPANEFSSPPTVDVSMTEDDSLTLTPTSDQAALFGLITDAVKTAPRSTDPENPSWHEKMLMYDPVVLEDLTAWLNGGQLDRVGWDGEVSTADVKKWCESRSVCCLWKVTNNGKDRARY